MPTNSITTAAPTTTEVAAFSSDPFPTILSAPEVARRYGVGLRTIRRETTSGRFPCHRLGSRVFFTPEDVIEWLRRMEDDGAW